MGSQKPLEYKTPNMRRAERNLKDSEALRKNGYDVFTADAYPNNAYYAIEKGSSHKKHERDVCEIAAENGLSCTLDKEGTVKVRLKDGRTYIAKSLDGTIEKFTQEIMALNGKPDVGKVVEAIEHSFKENKLGKKQATIAISITPVGSSYTTKDILSGVAEFKRKVANGETAARPRAYLHIDTKTRKIYVNKLY